MKMKVGLLSTSNEIQMSSLIREVEIFSLWMNGSKEILITVVLVQLYLYGKNDPSANEASNTPKQSNRSTIQK